MTDINQVIAMLRSMPPENLWTGSGASSAKVREAEAALGVSFPQQLRAFVSAFGWGGPDPFTVFGVDDGHDLDSTKYPAIVRYNRGSRAAALSVGYLVVASSGDGGWLITKASEDGPLLVWFGSGEAPDDLEVAAESLAEYLLRGIELAGDGA